MFDRLGVGSSIMPPQPAPTKHSEHNESRLGGGRDPKFINTRFEDEKPELQCHLDEDDENLPFFMELKARKVPRLVQNAPMEKYNPRCDPTDHINVYKTKLQGNVPTIKYKNFHTILTFDTKRWYYKLKPESIRSWPQLKREFINVFIGNRTMIAVIAQLYDIR
ncbi:activating signal cointegrator 1 complex subunit 2-like protein [Abeliophyllum distichum]|uniref:Activating signal cointegrator 1 complex subunit 2-like protein n=1 Tax=Abeliophyllum distichum TaxID=126358 RepID=A0ABD1QX19_9LAMI